MSGLNQVLLLGKLCNSVAHIQFIFISSACGIADVNQVAQILGSLALRAKRGEQKAWEDFSCRGGSWQDLHNPQAACDTLCGAGWRIWSRKAWCFDSLVSLAFVIMILCTSCILHTGF